MFSKFYPDDYIESVYQVDYERLYDEGYRGVLYDIDNTLVLHDARANEEAKNLFFHLHEIGFKICLVSNNHLERVQSFAEASEADYFLCDAHKPSAKGYLKAVGLMELEKDAVLFFGDQLFTDVWGAKNAEILSVLVKPVGREKLLRIKAKRFLELPILHSYEKLRNKEGGKGRIPLL